MMATLFANEMSVEFFVFSMFAMSAVSIGIWELVRLVCVWHNCLPHRMCRNYYTDRYCTNPATKEIQYYNGRKYSKPKNICARCAEMKNPLPTRENPGIR